MHKLTYFLIITGVILLIALSSCATVTIDYNDGCVHVDDMRGPRSICGLRLYKKQ